MATDTTLRDALSAHFLPTDVEWRIGQAGKKDDGSIWAKAFAYITNRAIQERLDDVVGPGQWKNEYRPWEIGTPGVLCGLSLKVDGEWVTKWDGAEQTDMEALKGGLSSAMKRAAVQWGIGRYLYDLPEGWAKVSDRGAHFARTEIKVKGGVKEAITFKWDPPDLPTWALPENQAAANGNGHRAQPSDDTTDRLRRQQAAERSREPVTASVAAVENAAPADVGTAAPTRPGPYAPSEKQVAFFQRLADSPVFTEEERARAYEWLASKATRQTIKDQISWLQTQVQTRKAGQRG